MTPIKKYETDVCIAGGGPAGMMLGLLLAKNGLRVLVLEQHQDFEREYRGEVLMPRFIQMMRQIGLWDRLQKYHHLKLDGFEGYFKDRMILKARMSEIAPEAPFSLWMPQPILLGALHDFAKTYPSFEIWFGASVRELIHEDGKTRGVMVEKNYERIEVKADVTVGADGRYSILRRLGHFEMAYEHYDFDLIWFTVPRPAGYDYQARFFLSEEKNYLVLPKYPESLQCGLVVPVGEYARLREAGVEALREILLKGHSAFHDFAKEIRDFSPFSVLQARIELVKEWARDGLLLIGDSAHTCSPAGAIGVSVAVATATVAADVILKSFQEKDFSAQALGRVQRIREKEVREIQKLQKDFTHVLLSRFSKGGMLLFPVVLFILNRLGLFQQLQRQLMVMNSPLPIRQELVFPSQKE